MRQSKQAGSAAIIVLSVVIVALLGVIGWLTYRNINTVTAGQTTNQTAQSTTTTNTQPVTQRPSQPDTSTLSIAQLGIKFVNLPANLQDLIATPNAGSPQYIDIYAKNASTTISIASLSKVNGTYDGTGELQLAKQFSGFWISYEHPNGIINDQTVVSAESAFGTHIQDQANIQVL